MLQIKQKNAGSRAEWLVKNRYTFGTGVDNHYKVSGKGVNEIHAGLEVNGDHAMLFNLGGGQCVTRNGEAVEKNVQLAPGDEFTVGEAIFAIQDPKKERASKPATAVDLSQWSLKAKNTALANKSFNLDGTHTIGRSNECDICLNVVHLSRRHAQFSVKDHYVQIDDLNSSNGTYVNGKRVETAKLKAGDEVSLDTLHFVVIGPKTSLDKTQVRQVEADSDATTMRPALSEGELKEMVKKSQTKSSKAATLRNQVDKPEKTTPETPVNTSAETVNETGGGAKVMVAVIGVLIIAVAAYIYLA